MEITHSILFIYYFYDQTLVSSYSHTCDVQKFWDSKSHTGPDIQLTHRHCNTLWKCKRLSKKYTNSSNTETTTEQYMLFVTEQLYVIL